MTRRTGGSDGYQSRRHKSRLPMATIDKSGTRIETGNQRDPGVTREPGPLRSQFAEGERGMGGQPCKLKDAMKRYNGTTPMEEPRW